MARSAVATVDEYVVSLPDDRRGMVQAIRDAIRENLPDGYEEGLLYGMIGYYVPMARFPATYNKRPLGLAAIAGQKNYVSVYLNNVYGDPGLELWFKQEFRKTGKKLDMGKSCVRFRRPEDVPLSLIGQTVARTSVDELIAMHQRSRHARSSARPAR
jgi:hypothetical protein